MRLLLLVLLVFTFACEMPDRTPVREVTADAPVPPGAEEVNVTLTEFGISMPQTVQPGTVVFRVSNEGQVDHNFHIQGQGIDTRFPTDLRPGETRAVQIELRPGTYEVICPVEDHEERGMATQLTVQGEGQNR